MTMQARITAFLQGFRALRRLMAGIAIVLAVSVSAQTGSAGQSCCPMISAVAPCHSELMAGCSADCGLCQVQAPVMQSAGLATTAEHARHPQLVVVTFDQYFAQPVTPPPRG
jgi:hypothetical protein